MECGESRVDSDFLSSFWRRWRHFARGFLCTVFSRQDAKTPSRIIASLVVLTLAGQQAQSEQVEEVTYATEYVLDEENIIPGNWEKRDVGAIFNVTPTIREGGIITLVMMPELRVLSESVEIGGTNVTQPVSKTCNVTTTVHIPDGSAFIV